MNNQTYPWKITARLIVIFFFAGFTQQAFSQQYLRTNLFIDNGNGTRTLMDGNLTFYDDIYCNCVDYDDAWKMTNPGLNWGLLRSATTLVVERRKKIPARDTSFIRMWGMGGYNYIIQVIAKNLNQPNLIGYVRDAANGTQVPINLNDTTYVSFTVNGGASAAQDRFSVIFESSLQAPLPVLFTGIKLWRNETDVNVEWGVENETDVASYQVQYASAGNNFEDVRFVTPLNSGATSHYTVNTGKVNSSNNFYRVKATDNDGKIYYSNIAKIAGPGAGINLTLYPNPVENRRLQVQISVKNDGLYQVNAISALGVMYRLNAITANASQSSHTLILPETMKPGIYKIQFTGPGNNIITQNVSVR